MGMTASYALETPRDDATSIAVIHQALDLGVTLIERPDDRGRRPPLPQWSTRGRRDGT